MKICVGSVNKVKVDGVHKAFKKYFENIEVNSYNVSSEVGSQPLNLRDIVVGAYNRAKNALNQGITCEYGVGVEAGIFSIDSDYYMDVQITCIMHKGGFYSYGFSPAYPIPKDFVEKLVEGEYRELEEIVGKVFGMRDIGEGEGFVGILTDKQVTREDLTVYSTLMALIPHMKRRLY